MLFKHLDSVYVANSTCDVNKIIVSQIKNESTTK